MTFNYGIRYECTALFTPPERPADAPQLTRCSAAGDCC